MFALPKCYFNENGKISQEYREKVEEIAFEDMGVENLREIDIQRILAYCELLSENNGWGCEEVETAVKLFKKHHYYEDFDDEFDDDEVVIIDLSKGKPETFIFSA